MLFNSYEFVFFFLPLALFGFFLVARSSYTFAAAWLAAASLFFYGWWNPKYVPLLLLSIGFNYYLGYFISKSRLRFLANSTSYSRALLIAAVTSNLLLLGYFKYANFLLDTANDLTSGSWSRLEILLPLGISFFTFTQIAFLVDSYKGLAKEYSLVHYVLFVTYFPHLIAGPVLHHKQMMPQFRDDATYRLSSINMALGIVLFTLGMAKKVLLADRFIQYATPAFKLAATGESPHFFMAWEGALGYTLQLYFDFSGYSDMAIGLSLMFGVRLPINFCSPYQARNIADFWRRWHITLSQFLRDYLYIPLGGNRFGQVRTYLNLGITMLLGGLWHGANWTYILWGAFHGLLLAINHYWHAVRAKLGIPIAETSSLFGRVLGVLITFSCVVVGWVFFRANSIKEALLIISAMFKPVDVRFFPTVDAAATLAFGTAIVLFAPNAQRILGHVERQMSSQIGVLYAALAAVLAAWCLLSLGQRSEFLYFQF